MKKILLSIGAVLIIGSTYILTTKKPAEPIKETEISTDMDAKTTSETPTTTPLIKTETKVITTPVKITPPVEVKIESVTIPTTVPPGPKTFTLADIATHSDRTSCYTTIGGKVYDVTTYIDRHKGGASKILQICGKDGSSLFEGQHGGQMKPEQMLATFEIGILK